MVSIDRKVNGGDDGILVGFSRHNEASRRCCRERKEETIEIKRNH